MAINCHGSCPEGIISKNHIYSLAIVLLFANGCARQQSKKDRMYNEAEKLILLLKQNKPHNQITSVVHFAFYHNFERHSLSIKLKGHAQN